MIDLREKIKRATDLDKNSLELFVIGMKERLNIQTEIRELGYKYETSEVSNVTVPHSEEKTFVIKIDLISSKLGEFQKTIVVGLILSLMSIMEETTDTETKDRLDEQINQLMKDLNLTWEDIG